MYNTYIYLLPNTIPTYIYVLMFHNFRLIFQRVCQHLSTKIQCILISYTYKSFKFSIIAGKTGNNLLVNYLFRLFRNNEIYFSNNVLQMFTKYLIKQIV